MSTWNYSEQCNWIDLLVTLPGFPSLHTHTLSFLELFGCLLQLLYTHTRSTHTCACSQHSPVTLSRLQLSAAVGASVDTLFSFCTAWHSWKWGDGELKEVRKCWATPSPLCAAPSVTDALLSIGRQNSSSLARFSSTNRVSKWQREWKMYKSHTFHSLALSSGMSELTFVILPPYRRWWLLTISHRSDAYAREIDCGFYILYIPPVQVTEGQDCLGH